MQTVAVAVATCRPGQEVPKPVFRIRLRNIGDFLELDPDTEGEKQK